MGGLIMNWQQRMKNLDTNGNIDVDTILEESKKVKGDNVALIGNGNDSIVRISPDGKIGMFVDDKTGIQIDPKTKAVNVFGDNINFFSGNINMYTKLNGLRWNKFPLNLVPAMPPGAGTILPMPTLPQDTMRAIQKVGKMIGGV